MDPKHLLLAMAARYIESKGGFIQIDLLEARALLEDYSKWDPMVLPRHDNIGFVVVNKTPKT